MDWTDKKCVMIIDGDLPLGLAANTAAVMGVTLGRQIPDAVGADVQDGSGCSHLGIVEFPIPILRGSAEVIRQIRERLRQPELAGLTAVDFSDLAQGCRTYDEFIEKMGQTPEDALGYLGLAVFGPRRAVNKLTGSMPLLR